MALLHLHHTPYIVNKRLIDADVCLFMVSVLSPTTTLNLHSREGATIVVSGRYATLRVQLNFALAIRRCCLSLCNQQTLAMGGAYHAKHHVKQFDGTNLSIRCIHSF